MKLEVFFFTNLLKNKLVDELHIFQSNKNIGSNGKPLILNKSINDLNIKEISKKKFNDDLYQHLKII